MPGPYTLLRPETRLSPNDIDGLRRGEERLTMLALFLEDVGTDKAVRIGHPDIWRARTCDSRLLLVPPTCGEPWRDPQLMERSEPSIDSTVGRVSLTPPDCDAGKDVACLV